MVFELSLIHELIAGRHDPLQVGEVPERVRKFLGCQLSYVYLSKENCDKIFRKHPEVTPFDLLYLPDALKNGIYIADRERHAALLYKHLDTGKDYVGAVKVAAGKLDLWMLTFHRIEAKQIEGILRRGPQV